MSKKVLIISSSMRAKGNSAMLAQKFAEGAKAAGNETEFVSLHDKTIGFCKGCLACQKTQRCVIHDDADTIREKMLQADVLVFSTPIYYYEMSGQLKTLLDRANPLFPSDYRFTDVYFLSAAAENEDCVPQRAMNSIQGWIECFERANLAGSLFCGGVTDVGDIDGNSKLDEAYEMGRSV
ncbi:MAG: flavodoxin family protein [Oscillospiraceae bacterium]|nr:flavodoxin family protein [Oscillospiraceae bacterium]